MASPSPHLEVPPKDKDHVDSLERGLLVLRILTEQDRPISITELADSVGITRAAARRFALTLEHLGYVGQDAAGYSLRPEILKLGDVYLRSNRLPAIAHPHLVSLVQEVRETASLTVLHDDRVVFIDRVVPERVITANLVAGATIPAHKTATGRVLLGSLENEQLREYLTRLEVRTSQETDQVNIEAISHSVSRAKNQGWALGDQALTPGIVSIAVPVRGSTGQVIAALNVAAHASRVNRQSIENLILPLLQEAAKAVEVDLQYATSRPDVLDKTDSPVELSRPVTELGTKHPRPKDAVQSLERGLTILTAFNETRSSMNLREVAKHCHLSQSVARRFLRTLMNLGYLRVEGHRFEPTPKVLTLGYSYLAKLSLSDIVRPHVDSLSRFLHVTVSVGVLDGLDVRYVGRASAPSALGVSIGIGSRVPAHQTAMGRVLLAALPDDQLQQYLAATTEALGDNQLDNAERMELREALEQIRTKHHGYVDQLLEFGIRAIAIPLRNRRNEVVAALSVSVHEVTTTEQEMESKYLPHMRESAAAMIYELRDGGFKR